MNLPDPRRPRRFDIVDAHIYGGLVLVCLGVAFIYWPAALIVAGLGLIFIAWKA